MKKVRVKQLKGLSGRTESQRATIRGLGLGKINRERVLEDTPAVRGMINKVGFMLSVQQVDAEKSKEG